MFISFDSLQPPQTIHQTCWVWTAWVVILSATELAPSLIWAWVEVWGPRVLQTLCPPNHLSFHLTKVHTPPLMACPIWTLCLTICLQHYPLQKMVKWSKYMVIWSARKTLGKWGYLKIGECLGIIYQGILFVVFRCEFFNSGPGNILKLHHG